MGYTFATVDGDGEYTDVRFGGTSSIGYASLAPLNDALPGGISGLDGLATDTVVNRIAEVMPALAEAHRGAYDFTSIQWATEILIACLDAGAGSRFSVD